MVGMAPKKNIFLGEFFSVNFSFCAIDPVHNEVFLLCVTYHDALRVL
jgi:hypothetical protein